MFRHGILTGCGLTKTRLLIQNEPCGRSGNCCLGTGTLVWHRGRLRKTQYGRMHTLNRVRSRSVAG